MTPSFAELDTEKRPRAAEVDLQNDVDFDGECHPQGREVGVSWGL